jgi:hypothetical protein
MYGHLLYFNFILQFLYKRGRQAILDNKAIFRNYTLENNFNSATRELDSQSKEKMVNFPESAV